MSKIDIINLLNKYKEDTTTEADDEAFQTVIEWFINCTPDYKE